MNSDSSDNTQSALCIDPHNASQLVARLKVLPRDAVDAFLHKFGVQKIRDLSAANEAQAFSFVESLESQFAEASSVEEVDPFA